MAALSAYGPCGIVMAPRESGFCGDSCTVLRTGNTSRCRVQCTVHKVVLERRRNQDLPAAISWFVASPIEEQLYVEITPVGAEAKGLQTDARETRWGRRLGEASWSPSDESARLNFDINTSTELVVRVLGMHGLWQCQADATETLGEAQFRPSPGLVWLPLVQDGRISGQASISVRLNVEGESQDSFDPWQPIISV
mmetsp:Transcript_70373/g.139588  ORF Transcript_70373/g.139588 Transcript_70373/m.139588 type:complete len:196 (-) Transcript_70373:187-774(-)